MREHDPETHAGHCHTLREADGMALSWVCCRPRGHMGMHTSCGLSPSSSHHATCDGPCIMWYGDERALVYQA